MELFTYSHPIHGLQFSYPSGWIEGWHEEDTPDTLRIRIYEDGARSRTRPYPRISVGVRRMDLSPFDDIDDLSHFEQIRSERCLRRHGGTMEEDYNSGSGQSGLLARRTLLKKSVGENSILCEKRWAIFEDRAVSVSISFPAEERDTYVALTQSLFDSVSPIPRLSTHEGIYRSADHAFALEYDHHAWAAVGGFMQSLVTFFFEESTEEEDGNSIMPFVTVEGAFVAPAHVESHLQNYFGAPDFLLAPSVSEPATASGPVRRQVLVGMREVSPNDSGAGGSSGGGPGGAGCEVCVEQTCVVSPGEDRVFCFQYVNSSASFGALLPKARALISSFQWLPVGTR